jgi:vacuolar-type H+-ATPase subunit E/Vma4
LSLGSNDGSNLARIVALETRQERLETRQDELENFVKDVVQRLTNARP